MACRRAGDRLVVTNINTGKYKDYTFTTDPGQVRTWVEVREGCPRSFVLASDAH